MSWQKYYINDILNSRHKFLSIITEHCIYCNWICALKYYTVGAALKYYTVGAALKYYTVGAALKYFTVGAALKYYTVGAALKSNKIL
jgi:hypothetical protein